MPLETKNRQKLLMICAGVVVLLFVGNSFIYEPLVKSWRDGETQIETLQNKVKEGETKIKNERYYKGQWEGMRTNALPSNTSEAEALLQRSFARWERASGVTRLSFKPQWKSEDEYMTLECRVDYSGDLNSITQFLYELEKDPVGVKVDNVELASRDDTGRQLSLSLQVSGLLLPPPPSTQQP